MMKRAFLYIPVMVLFLSCSETLDKLPGRNLYPYTGNQEFFPKEIAQHTDFYAIEYVRILKQLGENSLADKYSNHEIVRLTVVRSFRNHFIITIERTADGVILTEKETYRDAKPVNNGDTTKITYDVIELDSATGKYMQVRKYLPIGTGTYIEIETDRKEIDPIINNKARKLAPIDWNNLSKTLDSNSFWEMYPGENVRGFDGDHYILETHSPGGYYVVARWSPRSGDFKTIVDYITGLSTYNEE